MGKSLQLAYPAVSESRKRCHGEHASGDCMPCDHTVQVERIIPPEILVANALKFSAESGEDSKVIPDGKDMASPMVLSACCATYELQSVVEHVGDTAKSGHYFAYSLDVAANRWYKYDDANVTVSSESEATRRPYIAFYRHLYTTPITKYRPYL